MVMYFQDDFWQAISKLKSKEDQDAAIVALVRYHFDRSEPENPIADAILTVCKDRIELSQKRSKAGSSRKQNKIKTETKSDQNATTASHSLSNSISNKVVNKDNEYFGFIQQPNWTPESFSEAEQAEPTFSVKCLKVYNETMGRDLYSMPSSAAECINLREGRYTLEEIAGMLKMKRDQWSGTNMEPYLKPSTLFSSNHFDEYMDEYRHQNDEREFSDDEIPY